MIDTIISRLMSQSTEVIVFEIISVWFVLNISKLARKIGYVADSLDSMHKRSSETKRGLGESVVID